MLSLIYCFKYIFKNIFSKYRQKYRQIATVKSQSLPSQPRHPNTSISPVS